MLLLKSADRHCTFLCVCFNWGLNHLWMNEREKLIIKCGLKCSRQQIVESKNDNHDSVVAIDGSKREKIDHEEQLVIPVFFSFCQFQIIFDSFNGNLLLLLLSPWLNSKNKSFRIEFDCEMIIMVRDDRAENHLLHKSLNWFDFNWKNFRQPPINAHPLSGFHSRLVLLLLGFKI